MTAPNNQTVGQSLTLQCEVTTVRGITSRVDIVWSSGGELRRVNNANSIMDNGSLVYTDNFTVIQQLSTGDDGDFFQCSGVINTSPPVTITDGITLDVTGKYLQYVHDTYCVDIHTYLIMVSLKLTH